MGRLLGKLSLGLEGSHKSDSFIYPAPTETYNSAGIGTLQVGSAPASGPCSFTLDATNMVTCSNPASTIQQTPYLYLCGKNTSASAATVNYQLWKNGAVTSANSLTLNVAAGSFFSLSCPFFFGGGVAGDILEIRAWASINGVIYTFLAISPFFNCYLPMGKKGRLLTNLMASPWLLFSSVPFANYSASFISTATLYACAADTVPDANLILAAVNLETYFWGAKVVNGINVIVSLFPYSPTYPNPSAYAGTTVSLAYVKSVAKITSAFTYNTSDIFIT